jgi:hypothetical protein
MRGFNLAVGLSLTAGVLTPEALLAFFQHPASPLVCSYRTRAAPKSGGVRLIDVGKFVKSLQSIAA